MGVVKSPGKGKNGGKSGVQDENTKPDNVNKDIYFEKDFGTNEDERRTSLYKDKALARDDFSDGPNGKLPATANPFDDGPNYEGRPDIKDDKRASRRTVRPAGNPDMNTTPG
jgi:hypothetical protein